MFDSTITKDDLRQLPACQFPGIIHVVDSVESAIIACESIEKANILGFDTETRPSFTKGRVNTVAILQLSTFNDAYIFRLSKTGLPDKLIQILSSPHILKIGAAIHDDIRHLKKIKTFKDGGFVDLQSYVKKFGIENSGLSKIAGIVLKYRVSKSQQLSNWDNEILSEGQLLYAATDAWAALKIYTQLSELKKGAIHNETI
jgi:ribonuclease D